MAKSKGKRKRRNDSLVLQLMILVAVVLVVFEGKLVITMVTHRASTSGTQSAGSKDKGTTADGTETEIQQDKDLALASATDGNGDFSVLAGLPSGKGTVTKQQESESSYQTVSDPNSPAIVKEAATPVDDSYFSDAVFTEIRVCRDPECIGYHTGHLFYQCRHVSGNYAE